jgi:hypothetical protein
VIEQPRAATLGQVQMRAGVEHNPPAIRIDDALLLTLHRRHDTRWGRWPKSFGTIPGPFRDLPVARGDATCPRNGFVKPRISMPEEGLEPPTRGL